MTATYLYCIVSAARKPSTAKVPDGLPGASRPEAVAVTPSIWIIASEVPADVYTGEALEQSLADLDWVGRIALAHEAVVEHFSRQRAITVIPLKLFTMFSSSEKAAADIRTRKGGIQRTIRKLAGAEEWGVRVLRRDRLESAAALQAAPPASGAAFLAAKKHARDSARDARHAAAAAALRAFESLSEVARDSHRRTDAPPGGATPPLLDAAFLVPLEKRAAFAKAAKREAEACARAGAEMTLTGPWPAYNFVSAD